VRPGVIVERERRERAGPLEDAEVLDTRETEDRPEQVGPLSGREQPS